MHHANIDPKPRVAVVIAHPSVVQLHMNKQTRQLHEFPPKFYYLMKTIMWAHILSRNVVLNALLHEPTSIWPTMYCTLDFTTHL